MKDIVDIEIEYMEKYRQWCENPVFDDNIKSELLLLKNNDSDYNYKEIENRFYKDLSFGTGGLRGIMGAGTNRINKYTIAKITQGLTQYIIKNNGKEKGVVISYDSRKMSDVFAEETALCLTANGIKTYCFNTMSSTPILSFAVRQLNCFAGIAITASHNPPEYNGYKVYCESGSQITDLTAKEIIFEVDKIKDFSQIRRTNKSEAEKDNLYITLDNTIENLYIQELKKLILSPESIKNVCNRLNIVYTPLHGVGGSAVKRILTEAGFNDIYIVKAQSVPNGDFQTVRSPNPENKESFKMALDLAEEVNADIVLATDPDADRYGMYIKDKITSEYIFFTGNMAGILLAEYQLSRKKELGLLKHQEGVLLKTIVSSNMAKEIAEEYGISMIETLTGFKYIGEQIDLFAHKYMDGEKAGAFIYGFEESNGCLLGTYIRDKDGIAAIMALCEAAAYYMEQGLTLWDQMLNLYNKYGYYMEDQISITLEGAIGVKRINNIISDIQEKHPLTINGYKVLKIRDYSKNIITDVNTGKNTETGLPLSKVVYFELEGNNWFCIRPSGTEPKVKIYIGIKGTDLQDSQNKLNKMKNSIVEFITD